MIRWSSALLSSVLLLSLLLIMAPMAMFSIYTNSTILLDWTFFSSLASPMNLTVIFDPFGLLFSCTVLFISCNVMIFSHSYMVDDPFQPRFIHLVLLFVASMNFLIFLPNLMTLLLGWDGLGLVSFLLVIYYQNPKSLAAGMITALTNRIGDVLILLSIGWSLQQAQWNLMFFIEHSYSPFIIISLMIAAMTKSAQMPFSSWLPAAMAAPTPVSALVHSSTLVTAGVFMLVRFYPFLSCFKVFNYTLLILATMTTLMAGMSANTECDMKKIIALSTLSQLGVMMISIGLAMPMIAFFHLITHALFKALLFLCAGTLIHLHLHSQDLRFMGNLSMSMPSISASLMVSNLALCGTPFLAGFYSKDLILEFSLSSSTNMIIIFLFFFATGLTVSYTLRFLIAVMWSPTNVSPSNPVKDGDIFCTLPTILLSLGAIIGGAALNWTLVSPIIEPILPFFLKTLALSVSILGLLLGLYMSTMLSTNPSSLMNLNSHNYASCTMWFLAPISSQKIMWQPLYLGKMFSKYLDQGWEEMLGGQGGMKLISLSSSYTLMPQNHMLTSYLTLAFMSIPLFTAFIIFLGSLFKLKHSTEAAEKVYLPQGVCSVIITLAFHASNMDQSIKHNKE